MIVLGLETSSRICSVGLANDDGPSGVLSLDSGSIHSEKLLTLIGSLVQDKGIALSRIDALAVSSGPGSFTGLRIGFSAAKGLSLALGKPLVVVSTFESLAVSAAQDQRPSGNIVVALDAKKGDFYVGAFRMSGQRAIPEGDTKLVHRSSLEAHTRIPSGSLIVSDVVETIRPLFGKGVVAVEDAHKHFRGDGIAALGLRKFLEGEAVDVADAEPFYLKDFVVRKPSAV